MTFQCKACQSSDFSTIELDTYNVLECSKCGMGIVDPIPSKEKLNDLYNSVEYFAEHMSYNYSILTDEDVSLLTKKHTDYHLLHLEKFINVKNIKVLEIGCGGGFLLKGLEKEGAQVTGLETSNSSVDFIENRLKLTVYNANFETIEFHEKFELIILNHVLEHFVDASLALGKIASNLTSGGLVYIRVPDFGSYDRKKYGKYWPAFLPFHIFYFTEASIEKLLKKNGFELIYKSYFFSETFLKGMVPLFRKFVLRACHFLGMEKKFSGRTITVIARKID